MEILVQVANMTPAVFWQHVEAGLQAIAQRKLDTKGWTLLYNMFFNYFCSDKDIRELDEIYQKMLGFVEQLCTYHRGMILQSQSDDQLLQEYVKQRIHFTETVKLIRKVSSYMHRYFVPEYNKADVFLVALARWQALCVTGLEARLVAGVAKAIASERSRGGPDADDLLAGLVRAFADVRVAERVPAARLADPQHEQLEASHAARILEQVRSLKLTGTPESDWPRIAEILSRLPDDDLVQKLMQDNSASLIAGVIGANAAAAAAAASPASSSHLPPSMTMVDMSMRP